MPEQYQEEIEEILKQAGESPRPPAKRPPRSNLFALIRQYFRQSMGGKGWPISPGKVMVTAGLMLLAALLLRPIIPGIVSFLALAGLLIFMVGYLMIFVNRRKEPDKKWRGQIIEEPSQNALAAWWGRFRRRQK